LHVDVRMKVGWNCKELSSEIDQMWVILLAPDYDEDDVGVISNLSFMKNTEMIPAYIYHWNSGPLFQQNGLLAQLKSWLIHYILAGYIFDYWKQYLKLFFPNMC
jgi:hypothetical protein